VIDRVSRVFAEIKTIETSMTNEQHQPIAAISRDELLQLPEYTTSLPTGTTIGKRWRRSKGDGGWEIGEYVRSALPNHVGIKWYQVQLLEDLYDDDKHIENLEMLVVRLARYIEKATDGDSKLAEQAMDYMRRQARGSQSILRTVSR
jgi:hypothetical protein